MGTKAGIVPPFLTAVQISHIQERYRRDGVPLEARQSLHESVLVGIVSEFPGQFHFQGLLQQPELMSVFPGRHRLYNALRRLTARGALRQIKERGGRRVLYYPPRQPPNTELVKRNGKWGFSSKTPPAQRIDTILTALGGGLMLQFVVGLDKKGVVRDAYFRGGVDLEQLTTTTINSAQQAVREEYPLNPLLWQDGALKWMQRRGRQSISGKERARILTARRGRGGKLRI